MHPYSRVILNSYDADPNMPEEVMQLIDICREIVTLSKRSKLKAKLDTTLKQCVLTRVTGTAYSPPYCLLT